MSLTNEDINAIRALMQDLLQESETRIYGNIGERFQALEARLSTLATREELTNMETKLLTAFRQWASPAESRMRSNRVALREFDIVLESIEARLRKLEDNARPHQ